MLTPLIRLDIDTKNKLHYIINSNILIVKNDLQIFKNFNIVSVPNFTTQHFSGMSSMVFTYNPLMVTTFPFVKDYPKHAENILKNFLDTLSLFKTTLNTKLKDGPRIIQTITAQNTIQWLNIQGSDDTLDFSGKHYFLTLCELDELKIFFNKLNPILEKLNSDTILSAISFYSRSSRHIDSTEKFVFLSIALESLFSKENDELSYRFSNRMALLLGNTHEERLKISASIKKVIYKKRSMIVHGSNNSYPSDDEFMYLNELIRVSILKFISLYENGIQDPLSELDSFLLKQETTDYNDFKQKSTSLFGNLSNLQFYNIRKKASN